jgi:hypothetical protein
MSNSHIAEDFRRNAFACIQASRGVTPGNRPILLEIAQHWLFMAKEVMVRDRTVTGDAGHHG